MRKSWLHSARKCTYKQKKRQLVRYLTHTCKPHTCRRKLRQEDCCVFKDSTRTTRDATQQRPKQFGPPPAVTLHSTWWRAVCHQLLFLWHCQYPWLRSLNPLPRLEQPEVWRTVLVLWVWPAWSRTLLSPWPCLTEKLSSRPHHFPTLNRSKLSPMFLSIGHRLWTGSRQETSVFRYSVYTPLMECLRSLHSLTVIVKWDSKQHFLLGVDALLYTPTTFCSQMTGNDTGWQMWSCFQASGDLFL